MLKYGTNTIGKLYFGSNAINKAYYGSNLVYQSGSEPTPLPYDAVVEYLASDGTGAYIDTGIECTGDLSVELRAWWPNTDNAAIAGGIYNAGGGIYFRHHFTPTANYLYWYLRSNASQPNIQRAATLSTWHTFTLNGDTGGWSIDSNTGSVTPLSSTYTTGKSYGLFARIDGTGTIQTKASRLAYAKLSRGGTLLRDFIPVRVGTVGYLYDKVSQQLFGNAGSGSFTLGSDVD